MKIHCRHSRKLRLLCAHPNLLTLLDNDKVFTLKQAMHSVKAKKLFGFVANRKLMSVTSTLDNITI